MSSVVARRALFRASPRLRYAAGPTAGAQPTAEKEASKSALRQGARRDPELYVLFAVMAGVFTLAGWHFSRSPTSSTDEKAVTKITDSEPWKTGSSGKYQYHPGGDPSKGVKDAPSPLNEVVIPNVTLPKHLHDKWNKYGKDPSEY
ncbi:hypothetical protein BDY21DRAFT_388604 [Lineolata rhizophorae]|uniref:Uncharacterized protein n=1 Tax=Lineolata rhizophorae TaxID=578093 RepID=A0A6A6NL44_9PEZI|nr:hypothetical protein BDY21DRAFT_388604 [Lineolata rhizophorae]